MDGFSVECLKKGGMAALKWLGRLLNESFDMGVVHVLVWCMYSAAIGAPVQMEE